MLVGRFSTVCASVDASVFRVLAVVDVLAVAVVDVVDVVAPVGVFFSCTSELTAPSSSEVVDSLVYSFRTCTPPCRFSLRSFFSISNLSN